MTENGGVTVEPGKVHISAAVVAAIVVGAVYIAAWAVGVDNTAIAAALTTIIGILGYGFVRDIQNQ